MARRRIPHMVRKRTNGNRSAWAKNKTKKMKAARANKMARYE